MKYYNILFSVLLAANILNAQNTYSLKGKVLGIDGNPISAGNVIILSEIDSSIISGDFFLDGEILMDKIQTPRYILRITSMGYQDFYKLINHEEGKKEFYLGNIDLTYKTSEVVEISGRKQAVERTASALKINVANTPLSEAGTGTDVLRNSPKLFFDRNGNISILGQGEAIVYIDGVRQFNNQVLDGLTSNEIESINIYENPPARFESEGGAVIEVKLKKKSLEGYKIAIGQNSQRGKHFVFQTNTEGYLKIGKFKFQGNYNKTLGGWGGLNIQTRTNLSRPETGINDNLFIMKNQRNESNFRLHGNYQINDQLEFGLQYFGSDILWNKTADNVRTGEVEGEEYFRIKTTVTGPSQKLNNTINSYLTKNLDTLGSYLRLFVQQANFQTSKNELNDQQFRNEPGQQSLIRQLDNSATLKVNTYQLDISKNFSKNISFSGGAKFASIGNESITDFWDIGPDESIERLQEFSNDFRYRENISAAYSSVNGQYGKWNLSGGLRVEHTKTEIKGANAEVRSYTDVFPSISVSRNGVNLSYSRRIGRPLFQDINPYLVYVDSFVSISGNPELLPEYSNNFSMNYTLKGWTWSGNFLHMKGKINQVFRSLNDRNSDIITFRNENLDRSLFYSSSISRSFSYKQFSVYGLLGVFYDEHRIQDVEDLITNGRGGIFLQCNSTINLPFHSTFNVNVNYTSPKTDGAYIDNSVSYVNASLSRKFLNQKLKITLWANDIFDHYKWRGRTQFNNMKAVYLSEGDFRFVRLSLRYDFGKLGTGAFRGNKISQEELNRVNSI